MPRHATCIKPGKCFEHRPSPRCIVRFLSKVRVERDFVPDPKLPKITTPCWTWLGATDERGYPQFKWRGQARWAHRFSYETFRGGVPNERQVHHACFSPRCVNPDHLEVLTHGQNASRHAPAEEDDER